MEKKMLPGKISEMHVDFRLRDAVLSNAKSW